MSLRSSLPPLTGMSPFPESYGLVPPATEQERDAARRTLAALAARVGAPPADLARALEALGLGAPSPDPLAGAEGSPGGVAPAPVSGGRGRTSSKRHKATQPREPRGGR
jgi:hypothetical protein